MAFTSSLGFVDFVESIFWWCTKVPRRRAAYFAWLRLCLFLFLWLSGSFVFSLLPFHRLLCLSFFSWTPPPPLLAHTRTTLVRHVEHTPCWQSLADTAVCACFTHWQHSFKLVSVRFLVISVWWSLRCETKSRKLGTSHVLVLFSTPNRIALVKRFLSTRSHSLPTVVQRTHKRLYHLRNPPPPPFTMEAHLLNRSVSDDWTLSMKLTVTQI